MIVFINGQFVEEKDASIGVSDLSIQRGFGIFDFFRTSRNIPLFLEDYLDRFFRSATLLHLQRSYTREAIKKFIYEMIEKNRIETSGFKMILTGGYSPDGFQPGRPNFIITQQPVEISSEDKFEKGIKIILHEYLRDVPLVKSINYLMAVYLQHNIASLKADDVLYHKDGFVLEFPRSNVFIVTKDRTVVTPAENVLPGITRKKVLELAGKNYKTEVREITLDEFNSAAEVFLTSTTKRLLPVIQVEDKLIGDGKPGEITRALYQAFVDLENEYCEVNLDTIPH
jgi:branched-chain amino acid aminotransferase